MSKALRITAPALLALLSSPTFGQGAWLQVIHNCADLNANVVDIYLNGSLAIPDLEFRTATPFLGLPADFPLELAIAPGNSSSVADALFTQTVKLAGGERYVAAVSGTLLQGGYTPDAPFSFEFFPRAHTSAQGSGVDLLLMQGCTDAPAIDIVEVDGLNRTMANDAHFGSFSGYLTVPAIDQGIEVRTADHVKVLAEYKLPLHTMNLQGAALTVLASGFHDPMANGGGSDFGLWMATAAGGPLTPLAEGTSEEVVQGIDSGSDPGSDELPKLSTYPNPTRDKATLQVDLDLATVANVDVLDITGVTVRSIASVPLIAGRNRVAIDLSDLPTGLYTLRIGGEGLACRTSIMLTP